MSGDRKMKIGAILEGVGTDHRSWRDPSVQGDASIDVRWFAEHARLAEQAKMDFVFVVDSPFVTPDLSPHFLNRLEPLTLLSAVAMTTERIGLVGTASTTYAEPYNIARQFASLDHISGGRAGWNIVTTAVAVAARNFGAATPLDHADRYAKAGEFVEIAQGLWDSYEDDAFPRDKKSGVFVDKTKLHPINYEGRYHSVAGPLALTRSPQGQTVLFQAGDSDAGRAFAAAYADAVLVNVDFDQTRSYREDIRQRIVAAGRDPADVLVMAGLVPVIAETMEEVHAIAEDQRDYARLLAGLARIFSGHDFSRYDLDDPFPDLSDMVVQSFKGQAERILNAHAAGRLTIREAAIRFDMWASNFAGTPEMIADEMQRWFEAGICDGFMLRVNKPEPFRLFRERVVPLLQERGLFRTDYEGVTLRANLGLPVPRHRHQSEPARHAG